MDVVLKPSRPPLLDPIMDIRSGGCNHEGMDATAPAARRTNLREPAPADVATRVPPHAFFVVSAVFHYLGPSFAVLLFARVEVLGVAWLRIASAALIFAVWRRPWRTFGDLDRAGKRLLLGWAVVLAVMNC